MCYSKPVMKLAGSLVHESPCLVGDYDAQNSESWNPSVWHKVEVMQRRCAWYGYGVHVSCGVIDAHEDVISLFI